MNNKDMRNNRLTNLTGYILLSSPNMISNYLNRSMIYICDHSNDGALGVVINKLIPDINILSILKRLNIKNEQIMDSFPLIYFGGIEEIDKCFIVHSDECMIKYSQIINNHIALTISDNFVKSFTELSESKRKIVCIGCYTWSKSQLENEIASNYWIPIPADEALIFGNPFVDKWSKAFLKIGMNSKLFLNQRGNA